MAVHDILIHHLYNKSQNAISGRLRLAYVYALYIMDLELREIIIARKYITITNITCFPEYFVASHNLSEADSRKQD